MVFDLTNAASFKSAEKWLNELKQFGDKNIAILFVGNKSDLKERREVSTEDAKSFAQSNSLYYIETSALDGANVKEAFQQIVTAIHEQISAKQLENEGTEKNNDIGTGTTIKLEDKKELSKGSPAPKKGGCC